MSPHREQRPLDEANEWARECLALLCYALIALSVGLLLLLAWVRWIAPEPAPAVIEIHYVTVAVEVCV